MRGIEPWNSSFGALEVFAFPVFAISIARGKPVHIVSKVAIRMKKWLTYVVPSAQKP